MEEVGIVLLIFAIFLLALGVPVLVYYLFALGLPLLVIMGVVFLIFLVVVGVRIKYEQPRPKPSADNHHDCTPVPSFRLALLVCLRVG